MFTKQTSEDIERAYNDTSAEQVKMDGKYIGRLPQEKSDYMRSRIDEINFRHHQIQQLLYEFESLWAIYRIDVMSALQQLHISPDYFDIDTDDLHISKEGHVYIVRGNQTSE
jgi:hypothetical protein